MPPASLACNAPLSEAVLANAAGPVFGTRVEVRPEVRC
jgi:hypothetical protein